MKPLSQKLFITNNAFAAALLFYISFNNDEYLPVIRSPRIERPDLNNEIIRLQNIVKKYKPDHIYFYGVSETIIEYLVPRTSKFTNFSRLEDIKTKFNIDDQIYNTLSDDTATSLYKSLCKDNKKQNIAIVVENHGSEMEQVIAACYALYHTASFYIIPRPTEEIQDEIDDLLSKIDLGGKTENENLDLINQSKELIRSLVPKTIVDSNYDKFVFVTHGIPYGLLIGNEKTVHAPVVNLGHLVAQALHGRYIEKKNSLIGLFSHATDDINIQSVNEQKSFEEFITHSNGFYWFMNQLPPEIWCMYLEYFPFDILYVVSHSGNLQVIEETYKVKFNNNEAHEICFQIYSGITHTIKFVISVDGVLRVGDDNWQTEVHGKIISDFIQERNIIEITQKGFPVSKSGKAKGIVLSYDNEQHLTPPNFASIASGQCPMIIVNSCGSWPFIHQQLMFSGCSSFIGTLWTVDGDTAEEFAKEFFSNLKTKTLLDSFLEGSKKANLKAIFPNLYIFSGLLESKFDNLKKYDFSSTKRYLLQEFDRIKIEWESIKGNDPQFIEKRSCVLFMLNEWNDTVSQNFSNRISHDFE